MRRRLIRRIGWAQTSKCRSCPSSRRLLAASVARTRGSVLWGTYYVAFVAAAAIHGAIGVRTVLREWGPAMLARNPRALDVLMWSFGFGLLLLGLRAVVAVVFIDAPEELRWERVRQRSGWTLDELHRREASQLSLPEKRRLSDTIVNNATEMTASGRQFLTFLRGRWDIGCKPSAESSQQLTISSESIPPS